MTESAAQALQAPGRGRGGRDRGVPRFGASVSSVSPPEKGPCLRVLLGCGAASGRLQSRGAARDPASLQPKPRLPGWSSHLWESLALGFWLLSRDPQPHRGGGPPSPRGWRDAANQREGTPFPFPPFLAVSHRPPHQRQVLPIHHAAPAVKARGCSCACLGRGAAESPGHRKEGDPQENWRGTACFANPQDRLPQRFAKIVRQDLRRPIGLACQERRSAQPAAWTGNPHPPSERKEARKVSEGAWEFLQETVPSGSSGHGEKRGKGGSLTLVWLPPRWRISSLLVHKWLEGLGVGSRGRRAPNGPRALGRCLRIPFMPLGAAGLGAETQSGRAGLWVSAAPSGAAGWTLPSVRKPATEDELRGGREIPNKSSKSGLSAPACEPACLPNVTVK